MTSSHLKRGRDLTVFDDSRVASASRRVGVNWLYDTSVRNCTFLSSV